MLRINFLTQRPFNYIKIAIIWVSGKMDKKMDMENYIFLMEVLIVVILKMELLKEKADYYIQTETCILETGMTIKLMEKEYIILAMEENMKVNGFKI